MIGNQDPPKRLYHYTNPYGLSGIINGKCLWATKIQYLNDSQELSHGFEVLDRRAQIIASGYPKNVQSALLKLGEASKKLLSVNIFVVCFCEVEDLLSQWRGYGGAAGLSIGFSAKSIEQNAAKMGFSLKKCIYSRIEKDTIVDNFFTNRLAKLPTTKNTSNLAFQLASQFLPIAASFKHDAFREEQEWRLISNPISNRESEYFVSPTEKMLIPRVNFDLRTGKEPLRSSKQPWRNNEDICVRTVLVGPGPNQELMMDAVGGAFEAGNAYLRSVARSYAPYRLN